MGMEVEAEVGVRGGRWMWWSVACSHTSALPLWPSGRPTTSCPFPSPRAGAASAALPNEDEDEDAAALETNVTAPSVAS